MRGRSERTPKTRAKFLAALRKCPNVTYAARAVGRRRQWAYAWRYEDDKFAKEWDEAIQEGVERLEREMWRRAVKGVDEPVYQLGKHVGQIRRYSDTLAIFLAKGHAPEKYRERYEHSGPGGKPIEHVINVRLKGPDDQAE